ncbi:hypothetical protein R3I94_009333 [Phoxinus phoxinus]|uniref:Uncharacterized protein n=1 Tax=Phoxinus phoxinus TaxID=58324 RepID=A0AAN9CC15_9TELE
MRESSVIQLREGMCLDHHIQPSEAEIWHL